MYESSSSDENLMGDLLSLHLIRRGRKRHVKSTFYIRNLLCVKFVIEILHNLKHANTSLFTAHTIEYVFT